MIHRNRRFGASVLHVPPRVSQSKNVDEFDDVPAVDSGLSGCAHSRRAWRKFLREVETADRFPASAAGQILHRVMVAGVRAQTGDT